MFRAGRGLKVYQRAPQELRVPAEIAGGPIAVHVVALRALRDRWDETAGST
jgi:hypothetical protein